MSRQQDIQRKLPADPIAHVLSGGAQDPACGKVRLIASVIDTDLKVRPVSDLGKGLLQCLKGIRHPDLPQVLRLLPHIHIVRYDADHGDSEAVFQGHDLIGPDQFPVRLPHKLHIGTEDLCPELPQISGQIFITVVEIMISDGDEVIACPVHGLRQGRRVLLELLAVHGKGRALQHVASVQDQGVPVLLIAAHPRQKPQGRPALVCIGLRIQVAVDVRCKADLQFAFHVYPLASFVLIFVESTSMIRISTISPQRIAPTSFHR